MIDPTVRGVCASYSAAASFAALVQAIVTAEGGNVAIIKAVQCSDPTVTTLEGALKVVCRSVIHRMSDWVQQDHPHEFVTYMGSFWAPIGVQNDPTNLNANWAPNVSKLWTGF